LTCNLFENNQKGGTGYLNNQKGGTGYLNNQKGGTGYQNNQKGGTGYQKDQNYGAGCRYGFQPRLTRNAPAIATSALIEKRVEFSMA